MEKASRYWRSKYKDCNKQNALRWLPYWLTRDWFWKELQCSSSGTLFRHFFTRMEVGQTAQKSPVGPAWLNSAWQGGSPQACRYGQALAASSLDASLHSNPVALGRASTPRGMGDSFMEGMCCHSQQTHTSHIRGKRFYYPMDVS